MARTTRRRDPNEVVNFNRSTKKNDRRNNRKNTKKRLQEIDYTNPDRLDEFDEDDNEMYVKGYD